MNQPVPPAPTPLNMRVSPENRAKFTGFLEGVRSKAVTSQMPPPMPMQPGMMPQGQAMGMPPMPPQGMMPPMQPPMMPPRPPMPMNMGGMVDVFDPRYMNEGGFVISTDEDGKIATRPVFSEDRGRMVSQILSRDMVDDMANKTRQSPPIADTAIIPSLGEIISEKIIEEKILDNAQRADDSLKGVPDFTTTTIESKSTPILSDTDVTGPTTSNIALPARKPKITRIVRDIDDLGTEERTIKDIDDLGTEDRSLAKLLAPSNKNLISEQISKIVSGEGDQVKDVSDPQTVTDFILDRGDAVFDTPTLGNLSRNVRVTRDAPKGDFSFSADVPVEKLADLYKENTLEDVLTRQEEKQGLDLLAMFLNAIRPQFTTESAGFEEIDGTEEFPPSTALRSDRFNNGGIVQGFRNGGFTTNLRAAEPERAREIEEARYLEDLVGEYDKMYREPRDSDDLGSATPIFKTVGEGRSPVSGNVYDAYTRPPKDFTDLRTVKSTSPLTEGALPSGSLTQGAPDNMFGLNRFTKPIIDFLGYDTSTPAGVGKYYADTARSEAAYLRGQEERKRDQDREAAKLAEEQRLRDMIQGMLPPTAATATTTPVADAPTADPVTPDYGSVVVPSDRVPGFDVGNISPYPQFRMPTEFSPVFPTSLSANYFKDLFKNIGVQNMQQGGSVNQLDSAIDNFINAYR